MFLGFSFVLRQFSVAMRDQHLFGVGFVRFQGLFVDSTGKQVCHV